ncbi:MAG TPA: RagB/SusD family nutrient uptake outer membrane protein, partial [Flavisolibacter sp.]
KQEAGRATSGAAKTLLANAYIVQKKWAEAEALLKDVVNGNEYSLMPDYANAFSGTNSNKNNAESVFEVQFLEGSAGYNGTIIYNFLPRPMTATELQPITGTSNPQGLSGEGNNAPTPDIITAYETGDKRKDASIAYVTLSQSLRANKVYPYIKKFAALHAQHGNTGNNFPIYRFSEVLLLLAEALNEQGKGAEALPFLNKVRDRAFGNGVATVTTSAQTQLRDIIAKERRVELAFENKRWFDLVRTGKAVEVITAYGNRVKANPQDYYYPAGAVPPNNAFTNLDLIYGLPADEAALSHYF